MVTAVWARVRPAKQGQSARRLLWVSNVVTRSSLEAKLLQGKFAAGGTAEIAVTAEARNFLKAKFVKLLWL